MKIALLIGINYKGIEGSELTGCIDDIFRMRDMLINEMGFETENITMLHEDVNDVDFIPTNDNILHHLNEFINNSKETDELWFHYSGHGSVRRDRSNDELTNIDSVMIPYDFQTKGVILDDEIYAIIKNVKCNLFLLLDCCHSGSICDLPWSYHYANDSKSLSLVNINNNVINKHIYALSGSEDTQLSMEKYNVFLQKKVGVLTNTFLMLLHYYNYNVNIKDLFIEICEYLKYNEFVQNPVLSASNNKIDYCFKCN